MVVGPRPSQLPLVDAPDENSPTTSTTTMDEKSTMSMSGVVPATFPTRIRRFSRRKCTTTTYRGTSAAMMTRTSTIWNRRICRRNCLKWSIWTTTAKSYRMKRRCGGCGVDGNLSENTTTMTTWRMTTTNFWNLRRWTFKVLTITRRSYYRPRPLWVI